MKPDNNRKWDKTIFLKKSSELFHHHKPASVASQTNNTESELRQMYLFAKISKPWNQMRRLLFVVLVPQQAKF